MASGILEVQLVDAKGLGETHFFGHIDPYVLIQYEGQERKSSVARGQGSKPVWKEKFLFNVEYPGSGEGNKLILKIMEKDTFSADDYIGQTTIYVNDLLALGAEEGTAELHPNRYRVIGADQNYRGEIEVGVVFTRNEAKEEYDEREFGGWKQSHFQ